MSGMDRLTVNPEDMNQHIVSRADNARLVVSVSEFWIVKFLHDGAVEFNDKLTPKQGSEESWALLQAEARRASQADPAPSEEWEACTCGPCPLHPAATAPSDGLREAAQQMLIEYDEVDIAGGEPTSLTAAVLALRAALTPAPAQEGGE